MATLLSRGGYFYPIVINLFVCFKSHPIVLHNLFLQTLLEASLELSKESLYHNLLKNGIWGKRADGDVTWQFSLINKKKKRKENGRLSKK